MIATGFLHLGNWRRAACGLAGERAAAALVRCGATRRARSRWRDAAAAFDSR
jgi:hypothetical protein